jgi:predicted anti-sigma-YlaC factor YlaD
MSPNTDCKICRDLLQDYLDNRLRGRKLRALENHLGWCADCRLELRELDNLKQALNRPITPQASEAFWERSLNKVFAAPRPRRTLAAQVWKPAAVLALSVLAVALIQWSPWISRSATAPSMGEEMAQAEIPEDEYLLQHSGFAGSQPLSATSHYLLLSARAAENNQFREQINTLAKDNEP